MASIAFLKIRSSSLVETIVALVIILAVFGIASVLFLQVINSTPSLSDMKADTLLEEYVLKTHEDKAWFDEELLTAGRVFQRRVSAYGENDVLKEIQYYIYDEDHRLLTNYRELIFPE